MSGWAGVVASPTERVTAPSKMATRTLTLAVMAALLACAAAELPTAAFKNEGGPTFLVGPTFSVDADKAVASMAWNHDGGYTAIIGGAEGNNTVLRGEYTSWECVEGKPGYYTAQLTQTKTTEAGEETTETLCEFGVADEKSNRYAQSADGCPTDVENEDFYFAPEGAPKRDFKYTCA
ncbi:hypothetical protein C2E21_9166 [Chlorella sorokiniana]|uniref:Uncharacterized protein n=1 Tax=Chlorella sorokiniana TaxID=3076 RepID=A0A2P6TCD8_CHLSO|nr:hypothetical protein C2E21_9166 [Chlorella sorokiniana]|eukprot:PRW20301.1 hypothetical protein C2E21_9166 [Chlorella sorokiniana]